VGEVPNDDVVPLSKTLDHVGPITRNVADAAAIWAVLADQPQPRLVATAARDVTLGALDGYFTHLLERAVRVAFEGALARLREAGVRIVPRAIECAETIADTYLAISLPEAAHWHAPTIDARASDYQPPVRERIVRGRNFSAVQYLEALDARERLRRAVDAALEKCNALVLPALAIVAPKHGAADVVMDNGETVLVRAAMLRLTQAFNVSGHPAISIPIPVSGLPVGLQLVGRRDRTPELLAVAATVEQILSAAAPSPTI
jgi:aspartyl-tRNA(Asn)/glutamyl-tRNA(Gln) amidotransferase subunit A